MLEVMLGEHVAVGVMRHPPGHVSQSRRRGKDQRPVVVRGGSEQPWCDLALEVVDDGRVQVGAADLAVRGAKGVHGRRITVHAIGHAVLDRRGEASG
jgi:hypothetical protein